MKTLLKRAMVLLVVIVAMAGAALAGPEKTLPDGKHLIGLSVPDMECSMCIRSVQSELKHLEGVVDFKIDDLRRVVVIRFDPSLTDVKRIQSAIRKAGFTSQLVEPPTN